jgi:predicted GNAT family acetyltransferase
MSQTTVRHNRDQNRFEIELPDRDFAVLEYKTMNGDLALLHTYVPADDRGQGHAEDLAEAALEYARAEGLRVRPYCRFVASYFRRKEQYRPLLADDWDLDRQ